MKDYLEMFKLQTSKGLDISVYQCTPQQFSEPIWKKYFMLCDRLSLEFDPDSPPTPTKLIRNRMLNPSQNYDIIRWLAINGRTGQLLGKCSVFYPNFRSPLYDDSVSTADIEMDVDLLHRRKGIGTSLLEVAARMLLPLGRGDVQTSYSLPSGYAFFQSKGARIVSERVVSRLYLCDVNWDLMAEWTTGSQAKKEGTRLEFHEVIPEADLEEFCRVYTLCGKSVPDYKDSYVAAEQISPGSRRANEKRWKSLGIRSMVLLSREPDGAISGFTECFYLRDTPHVVKQDLTGVLIPYRNRGLGKWLKAAMILQIMNDYPEVVFVDTGNAIENSAVTAINNAMGYNKFRDQWLAKLNLERIRKDWLKS